MILGTKASIVIARPVYVATLVAWAAVESALGASPVNIIWVGEDTCAAVLVAAANVVVA
ncbi:hypothetical protein E1B28_013218 [Marasmius oreades]|uniref:Uncharacterized protein n=1 Tax=Marasmius oreades TaxID=181124 RepID=A0A9P7RQJ4_9AGAR|nr:uncharacterized protein E1B28_013218 [Marasmius oreades]KAG7087238.1 hypothetical protein E1B28_013218 [Marasmius oreades]